MVHLETERLKLATWDEEGLDRFRPIATDPAVMRFITGGTPWPDERIRLFIGRNRDLFRERGFCRWKLEEKASGELIGFCGPGFLHDLPDPEIGWWLRRDRWGAGLATEAARAAFKDATERVKLRRIISIAHPDNRASIRIMQKLGLQFEKAYEFEGEPLVMYAFNAATDPTP